MVLFLYRALRIPRCPPPSRPPARESFHRARRIYVGHDKGKADTGVEWSQRVYSTTVTSVLRLAAQMHFRDCGCDGSLSMDGVECERADFMTFFFVCLKCRANFGSVPIGGTCSTSTTLDVLMPGSTFDHWMGSHEFSNSLSFSSSCMLRPSLMGSELELRLSQNSTNLAKFQYQWCRVAIICWTFGFLFYYISSLPSRHPWTWSKRQLVVHRVKKTDHRVPGTA